MNENLAGIPIQEMPFFLPGQGSTDVVFIVVTIALFLVVLGLGALYFTIQAWPDRLAIGAGKVQLQIVGLLGMISLITLDNIWWILGLLVATIRLPDVMKPLREIAASAKRQSSTRASAETGSSEEPHQMALEKPMDGAAKATGG